MTFTHNEYVQAILALEREFSPRFQASEYASAIIELEKEFVEVCISR
jgi:hypothetical protein